MIELLIAIGVAAGLMASLARLALRYPVDSRGLIDGAVVGDHARAAQPLW
jgi:hypothetical protein